MTQALKALAKFYVAFGAGFCIGCIYVGFMVGLGAVQ